MKKTKIFITVTFLFGMGLFTACEVEENEAYDIEALEKDRLEHPDDRD